MRSAIGRLGAIRRSGATMTTSTRSTSGTRCCGRTSSAAAVRRAGRRRCAQRRLTFGDRVLCPFLRPFFLDAGRRGARHARGRDAVARSASAWPRRRWPTPALLDELGLERRGDRALARDRSRLRDGQHRGARRRVPPARLAAVRRVQRRVAGRPRLQPAAGGAVRRRAGDGAVPRAVRRRALHAPIARAARRAARELPRVGRHGVAAAHRDRRLARRADLERVRDPARRLHGAGVPTIDLRSARPGVRRPAPDRRRRRASTWSTAAC